MKGTVFDVTGNKAYGPEGSYKGSYRFEINTRYQYTDAQCKQSSQAKTPLEHLLKALSRKINAVPTGTI